MDVISENADQRFNEIKWLNAFTLHNCCPVDSSSNGWRLKHFEHANKTTCELIFSVLRFFDVWTVVSFVLFGRLMICDALCTRPFARLTSSDVLVCLFIYLINSNDLGLQQAQRTTAQNTTTTATMYIFIDCSCWFFLKTIWYCLSVCIGSMDSGFLYFPSISSTNSFVFCITVWLQFSDSNMF